MGGEIAEKRLRERRRFGSYGASNGDETTQLLLSLLSLSISFSLSAAASLDVF